MGGGHRGKFLARRKAGGAEKGGRVPRRGGKCRGTKERGWENREDEIKGVSGLTKLGGGG